MKIYDVWTPDAWQFRLSDTSSTSQTAWLKCLVSVLCASVQFMPRTPRRDWKQCAWDDIWSRNPSWALRNHARRVPRLTSQAPTSFFFQNQPCIFLLCCCTARKRDVLDYMDAILTLRDAERISSPSRDNSTTAQNKEVLGQLFVNTAAGFWRILLKSNIMPE